ncbi:MAG: cysteine hydrolase [Candidatus Tectomicrobia bacterium]|uniref:Cysteine hydrolase n=1 Tax=Tectimicrobiota bacterium TaxID=2528274 RepID=A0A932CM54_UNCTE|nr:cysteine hydrolase [Candidatus Tectomicrobia bacterium]
MSKEKKEKKGTKRQFGLKDIGSAYKDNRLLGKVQPVISTYPVVPEKTALLVLDMNYVCAHPDYGIGPRFPVIGLPPDYFYDRIDSTVIPSIQKLLKTFREKEMKVIYTSMGCEKEDLSDLPVTWRKMYPKIGYDKSRPGTKEFEIREEVKPQPGEPVLLKKSSGAFLSTDLDRHLKGWGVDTLVIVGVESDCCIYNTAIVANDIGYKTIVVSDGCTTLTETGHRVLLHSYGELFFFNVHTADELIAEIEAAAVPAAATV